VHAREIISETATETETETETETDKCIHMHAHTQKLAHAHTRKHAHAPERQVCEGCRKYVGDLILSACVLFSSSPFPISPVLLVCPAASRTAFEIDCRLVTVGVDILRICKEQNMFYESTHAEKKPYMCLVKDIQLCCVPVS